MLNTIKKNRLKECPICEEKIKQESAYLTYLKIEGDWQLCFLHRDCYKKVKKYEKGEN